MKIHDSIHSLRATHLYRRYRNDCARTLYGTIFRTVIIILTHRIATTTTPLPPTGSCVCAQCTLFIILSCGRFGTLIYANMHCRYVLDIENLFISIIIVFTHTCVRIGQGVYIILLYARTI